LFDRAPAFQDNIKFTVQMNKEVMMKSYRKQIGVGVMLASLSLFACVTINIYFPAEKVESVAGEIVNDIRGGKTEKKTPDKDKSSLIRKTFLALAGTVAWAEDVTSVSNPTIRALKNKMKARFTQMKPFYQKNMLKEKSDGYVALGDTAGLGLKEKRDLKGLVDAENRDRETLYQEVAKAMKIDPSQINKIAEIFAKEWQKTVR
jgi:hypothetical protein